jgi:hypothetical protein
LCWLVQSFQVQVQLQDQQLLEVTATTSQRKQPSNSYYNKSKHPCSGDQVLASPDKVAPGKAGQDQVQGAAAGSCGSNA